MRWISFAIILLIATVLEAGNLLNVFAVGGWTIRPGILITLLVFYSFSCRGRDAIICSFIIGFAADLTGTVMGPHIICFGLLGLLLNQSNQILYARRAIYKVMIVFAVYLIAETFSHWLGLLKGLDTQGSFYSILLFTAVYSALISPVIWSILSSVSGGFAAMKSKSDRTYR
ncbi:MAG: rod shape-determining protein MreD [Planctomycetota bacterium]|nr:MAG: rod shape-determining protein MreD [Planctomycetota bacterium]RKY13217.1 MAG: rod shape-determining protein MreD [Planctomycetota bacterium]